MFNLYNSLYIWLMALIAIYISLLVPSGGPQIRWKVFIHQLNGAHGCQSVCALVKHAPCLQNTNKRLSS